jgi:hypothetical protein
MLKITDPESYEKLKKQNEKAVSTWRRLFTNRDPDRPLKSRQRKALPLARSTRSERQAIYLPGGITTAK